MSEFTKEEQEKIKSLLANDSASDKSANFARRRVYVFALATIATALAAILSFGYMLPAFPYATGELVVMIGVVTWIFLDEYLWEGDTIAKIGENPVAVAICVLAIAVMFSVGFEFGNSYVSNPFGNERVERIETPAESPARGDIQGSPIREGNSAREQ
ncbi:MAG: hypothetical protein ACLFQX_08230 [Candidatus Kapaibacterium sp.]